MRLALLVLVSACGRIEFDPLTQQATGADATTSIDAPLATCATDNRIVACYTFDGDAHDGTGMHDAVATNVTYRPGHGGQAIVLTAASDLRVAETPTLDPTNKVSIDLWAFIDQAVATTLLVDYNRGYGFYLVSEALSGQVVTTSPNLVQPGVQVPIGQWHHLAMTYNGAVLAVFLDGTKLGSAAASGTIMVPADRMQIGANAPDPGDMSPEAFVGAIDDLRIWNVGLQDTEVCMLAGTC